MSDIRHYEWKPHNTPEQKVTITGLRLWEKVLITLFMLPTWFFGAHLYSPFFSWLWAWIVGADLPATPPWWRGVVGLGLFLVVTHCIESLYRKNTIMVTVIKHAANVVPFRRPPKR